MKKFVYVIIAVSFILILSGCSHKDEELELTEKVNIEIKYLDNKITKMMNNLNNISFQNNMELSKQIDWQLLKNDLNEMYTSWNIIVIDLYKMQISNNNILEFSSGLDNVSVYIKAQEKTNTLLELAKLYSYIPKYAEKVYATEAEKNIILTKHHILNAYALVETNDWDKISDEINSADTSFSNINNDIDYITQKSEVINKTYVALQELKNSLKVQNNETFYMKYSSLIQQINYL